MGWLMLKLSFFLNLAAFFVPGVPILCLLTFLSLGLPSEVLTNWQVFVQRDLAAINEAQTITKVSPALLYLSSLFFKAKICVIFPGDTEH